VPDRPGLPIPARLRSEAPGGLRSLPAEGQDGRSGPVALGRCPCPLPLPPPPVPCEREAAAAAESARQLRWPLPAAATV